MQKQHAAPDVADTKIASVKSAAPSEQKPVQSTITYPLWFGGSASCLAVCLTHPLDLVKVRMQAAPPAERKGVVGTFAKAYRAEGVQGWYRGLTAGIARQILYGTTRFAIYESLKQQFTTGDNKPGKFLCVGLATASGFVGGLVGNPADLANVRMQNDAALPAAQRRGYRNVLHAWYRMGKEGGITAYFQGLGPNSLRSAVVTGCQLGCYDVFKSFLIESGWFDPDNTVTHLTASVLAGVTATTVCNPIDVIKTQMMQRKKDAGSGNMLSVLQSNIATDGLRWMMRGWLPSFLRVAPHTVATLVFFEQHKKIYRAVHGIEESTD